MQLQGKAWRVTIYIGESDRHQGKILYMALLQFLKKEGAAGATVLRGLAGFGAHSRIHTATILDLSADLPVRIEWIDQPETVERLLPQVRRMVDDGLITVEAVDVAQYAPGRRPDPLAQPVGDVMRTEVISVGPDTPAAEVVTLLLQKGYRSLPVVGENGRLAGWISRIDILRTLEYHQPAVEAQAEPAPGGATIGELMYRDTPTVSPQATLEEVLQALEQDRRRRAVVVDEARQVVGIISDGDLLRRSQQAAHPGLLARLRRLVGGQDAGAAPLLAATETAVDLMTSPVITIPITATPSEALRLMVAHGVKRLPVVDENGRLLGLLGRASLLQALL